ncbi:uncharacterized protein LOC144434703 [Glandiceps talaboti]
MRTKTNMFGIGVSNIIIGSVLIIFGCVCVGVCWADAFYRVTGGPIWTGALGVIAGVIGVYASKSDKEESMSVIFLVLNIFAVCCSVFVFGSAMSATFSEYGNAGFVINIFICVISMALMITACMGAFNNCTGGGNRTEVVLVNQAQMMPTQPPIQTVQTYPGPSGYTNPAYSGQAPLMQPMYVSTGAPGQAPLPGTTGMEPPPLYTSPQPAPMYGQVQPQPGSQYGQPQILYGQPQHAQYGQQPPPQVK